MATDDRFFETLRSAEFSRLDRQGVAYLDYTGSALYAESHVAAHLEALRSGVFGNPHSEHEPSRASTAALDRAREVTLAFFGVSSATHVVCFTANTTAAIKLVAEGFGFDQSCHLVLSSDNHNSINGLREYARRAGACVEYLSLDDTLRLSVPVALPRHARASRTLFAFPAQSNFSGVRHPLDIVEEARAMGWRVLLDAASLAPAGRLDLSACPADFVPVSFYKMFGYPAGIGALVARRDAFEELERPWFSGGTVEYVSVQQMRHQLRTGHEGFEDGTPPFLSALAIPAGFEFLERVDTSRLQARLRSLTEYLLSSLTSLRHENGRPAVVLYGPADVCGRGAVVTFNLLDAEGYVVPYWTVEAAAREAAVAIRGGCFCNPGAAEAAFRFDPDLTARCLNGLGRNFSVQAFSECAGRSTAVGALRASLGIPTTTEDIRRLIEVIRCLTPVVTKGCRATDLAVAPVGWPRRG
jgi:selenocysteine lyase/cysteine desulfurase